MTEQERQLWKRIPWRYQQILSAYKSVRRMTEMQPTIERIMEQLKTVLAYYRGQLKQELGREPYVEETNHLLDGIRLRVRGSLKVIHRIFPVVLVYEELQKAKNSAEELSREEILDRLGLTKDQIHTQLQQVLKRHPSAKTLERRVGLAQKRVNSALAVIQARRELVLQYQHMVRFWANKLSSTLHWVSWDDLCQAGNEGLLKAVDLFDPNQGTEFNTYARYWIKAEIWASPEVTRNIPSAVAKRYRAIRRAHDTLMQEHKRKPTIEEIACRVRVAVTAKEVEEALTAVALGFPEALPEWDDDSEDNFQAFAISEDIVPALETRIDTEKALSPLPERARAILIYTYLHDLSDSDIAKKLNMSVNSVKTARSRAIQKLQAYSLRFFCACPSCLDVDEEKPIGQSFLWPPREPGRVGSAFKARGAMERAPTFAAKKKGCQGK
ncbi:MAG: sigma-70 family RNA polymerase sigma factor [Candidatus Binatia bacterium]